MWQSGPLPFLFCCQDIGHRNRQAESHCKHHWGWDHQISCRCTPLHPTPNCAVLPSPPLHPSIPTNSLSTSNFIAQCLLNPPMWPYRYKNHTVPLFNHTKRQFPACSRRIQSLSTSFSSYCCLIQALLSIFISPDKWDFVSELGGNGWSLIHSPECNVPRNVVSCV